MGDCRLVIQELVRAVRDLGGREAQPDRKPWKSQLSGWQEKYPLHYEQSDDAGPPPQFALEQLRRHVARGHDRRVGVGQHQMWTSQYWRFTEPYTWVNSGGLGTMGFAMPRPSGPRWVVPTARSGRWMVTAASR